MTTGTILLLCTVIGAVTSLVSAFVALDSWRQQRAKDVSVGIASPSPSEPQREVPAEPPPELLHRVRAKPIKPEPEFLFYVLPASVLVCVVALVGAIIGAIGDLHLGGQGEVPPKGTLSYYVASAFGFALIVAIAAFIAALYGIFSQRGSRKHLLVALWLLCIGVVGMSLVKYTWQ